MSLYRYRNHLMAAGFIVGLIAILGQCGQRSILHAAQLWREGEFEMARVCDRFGRLLLDNLDAFAGPIETEEGK